MKQASQPYKVIIADSHEIVRDGIAAQITEKCGVTVVGQAEDGYSTIKLCRSENPDLLMMDLSLIRPSGLEVLEKVRATMPDVSVLVLSSDASSTNAFNILSLGAAGFMPKQAKSVDFVAAVNSISLGFTCFPNEYIDDFVGLRRRFKRSGNIYGLSPREIEVLLACCDGAKSSEVAQALSISVRTVETHRNAIYKKTDCRDLTQLARIARAL